jgi:hypothetical protein
VLLPALFVLAAAAPAADIAIRQLEVIDEMTTPYGISVDVLWEPCGEENAYYYIPRGPIVLCLEINETPAPVFVAAHEAGHAMVYQLGLPVGTGTTAGEKAADELAALTLIAMGELDEVVGGAQWFMDMARTSDGGGGAHPTHMDRARDLLCLVDGAETVAGKRGGSPACLVQYIVTRFRWTLAIEASRAQ